MIFAVILANGLNLSDQDKSHSRTDPKSRFLWQNKTAIFVKVILYVLIRALTTKENLIEKTTKSKNKGHHYNVY